MVRVMLFAGSKTFGDVVFGKPLPAEVERGGPLFQDAGSQDSLVRKHQIAWKEVLEDTGFGRIETDGYCHHDNVLGIRVIGKDLVVNEVGHDPIALTHADDLRLYFTVVRINPNIEL